MLALIVARRANASASSRRCGGSAAQLPDLQFAAVISGRSRRRRSRRPRAGSTFPVAGTSDLAVFNLYRIAYCCTAIADRGGRLREFRANNPLSDDELEEDAAVTIETGWVDADLEVEFPSSGCAWIAYEGGSGRTPPEIKERLRGLSDRYTAARRSTSARSRSRGPTGCSSGRSGSTPTTTARPPSRPPSTG